MAAGPTRILKEMLNFVRTFHHAMGYAPGMDLLTQEDWDFLNQRLEEMEKRVADRLPFYEENYGEKSAETSREILLERFRSNGTGVEPTPEGG